MLMKKLNNIIDKDSFDIYMNYISNTNLDIHYLIISGSHSYGLNTENSDLDIRGIFITDPKEFWSGKHFQDVYDYQIDNVDIVLYSFHKFIDLLTKANPTFLLLLGVKSEYILQSSDIINNLKKNQNIFFSKKIFNTFGGYANQCLSRIHKAYDIKNPNTISFNSPELNHRNRQKGDIKELYKHCCHLLLLYYIGIDLLINQELVIYREKEHDLLMSIKTGSYPLDKIFELQEKLEQKFQNAKDITKLPEEPDYNAIYELTQNSMEEIYKKKYTQIIEK